MSTLDRAFIKAFHETDPHAGIIAGRLAPAAEGARHSPSTAIERGAIERPVLESPAPSAASLSVAAAVAPLSTFAAAPKIHEASRPMLEVDRLRWPDACARLLSDASPAWREFADQLIAAANSGRKTAAFVSVAAGEGRTTTVLALAKLLAGRGLKSVVVDADFQNPDLARACGISVETGWGDVLSGELPLGEALISAVEDGVTLMPWRGAPKMKRLSTSMRASADFATLRENYDLVLIDGMRIDSEAAAAEFASLAQVLGVDAVYVVRDERATPAAMLKATCAQLQRGGLHVGGIIENFTVPILAEALNAEPGENAGFVGRMLALFR